MTDFDGAMNGDPFGPILESKEFADEFSSRLRPPTRAQRAASFDATREQRDAARASTVAGMLGAPVYAGDSEAGASAPSAVDQFRAMAEKLPREDRAKLEDVLLDIEFARGEITSTSYSVPDEDEF
jgi:hypothetical protein